MFNWFHGRKGPSRLSCGVGNDVRVCLLWWIMIHTLSPTLNYSPAGALHVCCRWVCATDLFDEPPPVVHKWPGSLPRTCRQHWHRNTSAGISLYVIPGGKLQLLVLSKRERDNKLVKRPREDWLSVLLWWRSLEQPQCSALFLVQVWGTCTLL